MSGGYAKYLREAVPPLAERPEVSELIVLAFPSAASSLARLTEQFAVHVVERFYRPYSRFPSGEVVRILSAFRPDVVFVPNFRVLVGTSVPLVVMARNMEPLAWNDARDPLRQRVVNLARRFEGRLAAWRAGRIIAVSQFVQDFLVQHWKVPSAKVAVAYHGVDPVPAGDRPAALEGVAPGFMFTAGATRPSRGLEDLIGAFSSIPAELRPPLVIAGTADPVFASFEASLKQRALYSVASVAHIVWAGALSPAEMAWCYDNCGLFVMTSRIEACPNIALEAMSHSCIVVAADNPPLPEIFGPAATYYRAADVGSLAEALVRQLRAPDRGRAQSTEAARRAKTFDWRRTAERTVQVLRAAAGG